MPADAVPSWLWVESLGDPGTPFELPEGEAHHLVRVCRARVGEAVTVTDGRGGVGRARVLEIAPRVRLELETFEERSRAREAVVMCGAPEGSRADWLVEKLAELGVSTLQPIQCERGAWPEGVARLARLERLAMAALRQSRRAFRMEVLAPSPLPEALAGIAEPSALWWCDPTGTRAGEVEAPPEGVSLGVIGPSAGLAPSEESLLLDRGARRICLSDGRLRTETAAVAWAVWWAAGR